MEITETNSGDIYVNDVTSRLMVVLDKAEKRPLGHGEMREMCQLYTCYEFDLRKRSDHGKSSIIAFPTWHTWIKIFDASKGFNGNG